MRLVAENTHITHISYSRKENNRQSIRNMVAMYSKISSLTRIKYVLIAILLFIIGLVLMMTFFLMITIPLALAALAWGGIFLYLAATGRPYSDFAATLRWHKSRKKYM
jgi:hypothetical protein